MYSVPLLQDNESYETGLFEQFPNSTVHIHKEGWCQEFPDTGAKVPDRGAKLGGSGV